MPMNIATSPEPAPMNAPDGMSALVALPAQNSAVILFSDLLGGSPQSAQDAIPGPQIAPVPSRKQAVDGTDPALSMLLPFVLPQVPQILPPAVITDVAADRTASELTGLPQSDSTAPLSTQTGGMCALQFAPRMFVGVAGASRDAVSESASPVSVQTGGMSAVPFALRKIGSMPDGNTGAVSENAPADFSTAPQPASAAPVSVQPNAMPVLSFPASGTDSASGAPAEISARTSQPAQVALAGAGSAAELSPVAVQILAAPMQPLAEAAPENQISQRQVRDSSEATHMAEADGTAVAMQRRAMSEYFSNPQTQTKMSAAAVPPAPQKPRTTFQPETREQSPQAFANEPASPATSAMAGILSAPEAGGGHQASAPMSADFAAAVQVTKLTADLTEHLILGGRNQAEVQLRLHDGQEVTVSLRLEQGEWKPVFKTDTLELCRALEQNWHRAATQSPTPGVKFGTPVFESQGTQSDPGQNSQQQSQSGGRERSFGRREQEQEPAFAFPMPRRSAKPMMSFSAAAAVQLYA